MKKYIIGTDDYPTTIIDAENEILAVVIFCEENYDKSPIFKKGILAQNDGKSASKLYEAISNDIVNIFAEVTNVFVNGN